MTKGDKPGLINHESRLWVKDIKGDDRVYGLYLAKVKRIGHTKKGDPFLSITLSDRTGDIESRAWENAAELASLFNEGDILEIKGQASSYRNQIQISLSDIKVSDKIDHAIFLESSPKDINQMMGALRGIVKKVMDPHLKALTDRFLSDRNFIQLFKKAPSAKNFHHNYIGGLLEHTLSVCEMACRVADQYENLDRDLLIAGAFLHDIGKIREFKYNIGIDYSDEGRLLGHLVMGVAMVDEKLTDMPNFPDDKALRLKHLIISHHGQYEFGSPKRPKFLEAFALHIIDDLDAKINGLGRFMEKDGKEGAWTDFNRMLERYLLKGRLSAAEEEDIGQGLTHDERQKSLFKE